MWRERFYRDRRKIVPDGIEELLEPAAVAAWFMDDGTADRAGVSFQTHSFMVDEGRTPSGGAEPSLCIEDQPESEQRRLGCVRTRLERRSTQGARWSAHASGARLQTGPERDLDPVETVRRPPTNDRGEDTVRSRQ